MELKELMTSFAETLGIEGIEVKEGICSMTIDDIPMEFTEIYQTLEKHTLANHPELFTLADKTIAQG